MQTSPRAVATDDRWLLTCVAWYLPVQVHGDRLRNRVHLLATRCWLHGPSLVYDEKMKKGGGEGGGEGRRGGRIHLLRLTHENISPGSGIEYKGSTFIRCMLGNVFPPHWLFCDFFLPPYPSTSMWLQHLSNLDEFRTFLSFWRQSIFLIDTPDVFFFLLLFHLKLHFRLEIFVTRRQLRSVGLTLTFVYFCKHPRL